MGARPGADRRVAGSQRGAALAAALGVLGVLLGAAASIVDKRESLRWLWGVLTVLVAVFTAGALVLASPWWQHRRQAKRDEEHARLVRDRMTREHFLPRGQGLAPFKMRRGWYFTGRTRVLQELVTWLTASSGGDSKARVVTGKPGSGKSAVLGQLVILSDPERRAKALSAHAPAGTVPPQGCIDVSVHARGMTVADVVDTIALAAEVEAASPEDLLLGLQDRDRRLVVVVDAVDEAAAPDELASKLLNPLAATHGTGIRLLVGTRPHVLYRLGTAIEVLNLDDPAYLDPADLVEYTRRCLLLEGDPDVPTPYRGQPVVAAQVAEAVAARAHPLFLIAWLVSQSLIAAKTVVDVHEPRWQERLPSDVRQAMQGYLDQFKAERARVRDLLVPLAFAEGDGLAEEGLWAALATQLGTATYTPQDVRRLLQDTAAPDLLEFSQVDGRPAYRLFHAALVEYLQAGENRAPGVEVEQHRIQVQRRITEELLRRVPVGSTGSRDWFSADPYTRMHLATHAASGGQLDTLLDDPGFLSAADPDRLLPWLRPEMLSAVSPRARRAAGVYRRRAVLLRSANPQARAGILELAAAQDGDHELSTRFGDASTERPWRTVWAHGDQTPEHVEVGRQQGEALVVADGTPLAVTAAVDYYDQEWTLHCWDAAVGGALGEPLRVEHGPLRALAVLMLPNGTPRVIFSDGDGTLRSWDLAAGTEPSQPWVGSVGPIRALTVAPGPSGSPLAVSGGDDGRLQCWEPTTRTPVGDSVDAHAGPVTAVVPVAGSPTEPLVISAGEDGTIRCLDLATRRQRGRTVHVGRLTGLAATLLPDRTPLAVTVDENGSVTCWDLTLGTSRRGPLTRQGGRVVAVATLQLADQPLALTAEDDGTVRCWDPVTGTQIGPPLTGHLGGMRSLAAVAVGRTALAVTWDDEGYIRCWDIDTSAPITAVQGIGPITGVAAVALEEGAPLVVSGERYGTLRCWDLTSGFPIGDPLIGHHDQLAAVAVVKWPSHPPFLVSGGSWPWDGTLRRWDPHPDGLLGGDPLIATKGLKALATAVLPDGNPMAVTVEQGGDVLRCWDLNARAQRWHADLTDSVAAVATVTPSDGAVLVVTGSRDGTVQCWDLLTGRPHGEPATGHDEPVLTITTVSLSGRSPLAVTGARDGSVWCWDLATDPVQGQRLGQHSSPVLAIAALEQPQGSLLAATGSEYGTVRFWRLTGSGPTPEPVPVHASVYALATHGTLLIVGSGAGVLALDFSTTG